MTSTSDRLVVAEDRIAELEQTLSEVKSMLRRFDTPADAGRVRAFVGDLTQIVSRVPLEGV